MSAGDGDILDRLYTPDNALVAMNWLFENMGSIRNDMVCAVGAATYVAAHAMKRFAHDDGTVQVTGDDAEFLDMAATFCESEGYQFQSFAQGINPAIAKVLLAIAIKLVEKWLSDQGE